MKYVFKGARKSNYAHGVCVRIYENVITALVRRRVRKETKLN